MPELQWDETDFMDCLEVIPVVEEYEVSHLYRVTRHNITLTVVIWQFEGVIQLSLSQKEIDFPLTEFALCVREPVRYIKDKRGEYLEFPDCVIMPNRFHYQSVCDVFDKSKFNYGLTLHLAIKPRIQIRHMRA